MQKTLSRAFLSSRPTFVRSDFWSATNPEWSYFHLFFKKKAKVMNCKFRRLDTLVLDTENTLKIKNDAAYAPVKLESTQTPPGTGDGILAVFLLWSFRVELHK